MMEERDKNASEERRKERKKERKTATGKKVLPYYTCVVDVCGLKNFVPSYAVIISAVH